MTVKEKVKIQDTRSLRSFSTRHEDVISHLDIASLFHATARQNYQGNNEIVSSRSQSGQTAVNKGEIVTTKTYIN